MEKTKTVLELISFLKGAQRAKVFTATLHGMIEHFKYKPFLKTDGDSSVMFEDYDSTSTINFTEFKEIVASISQIDSITFGGQKLFKPSKRYASINRII